MIRRPVLAVVCVAASMLPAVPLPGTTPGAAADERERDTPAAYVVVLDQDVRSPRAAAHRHAQELGIDVRAVYSRAIHSYLADLTPGQATRLRRRDEVVVVERDHDLQLAQTGQIIPVGISRVGAVGNGVADIDGQDDAPVDVDVAVLDTGVAAHPDLNVVSQADCSQGSCVNGGSDVYGHGTHVAGIIGARDDGTGAVGVAPGARIHSIRVCDAEGTCSLSALMAGINLLASASSIVEVANLSLGAAGNEQALDAAISRAVDAGIVFAVAAGNETMDAGQISPANHPDVLAVSGMTDTDGASGGAGRPADCLPQASQDDHSLFFSNYGQVVDIAAPGACIVSTGMDGGYAVASGTSMSAPHVAGAAALVIAGGAGDPTDRSSALAIVQSLVQAGGNDWTDDSGDGIQEPLLDVGSVTAATGASPQQSTSPTPSPTAEPSPTSGSSPETSPTMAASDELTRSTTEWIYYNTPESVDWNESNCIAYALVTVAGADLVASGGGDLTQVYAHTTPAQDESISAVLPHCLDPQSRQDLQAAGWPW